MQRRQAMASTPWFLGRRRRRLTSQTGYAKADGWMKSSFATHPISARSNASNSCTTGTTWNRTGPPSAFNNSSLATTSVKRCMRSTLAHPHRREKQDQLRMHIASGRGSSAQQMSTAKKSSTSMSLAAMKRATV